MINGQAAVFWLGYTDHVTEGTFLGVDGVAPPPTLWKTQEPNNNLGIEDCVHLQNNGDWNDVECIAGGLPYVCECDGKMPVAPATYCDTTQDSDCGVCGNDWGVAGICMNQVCM